MPEIKLPEGFGDRLREKRGVFVTLCENKRLRGCIGTYSSSYPLYRAACRMAAESAVHDPRFTSVSPEELNDIKIEISVYLSGLESIHSIYKFVPGGDGNYS